MRGWDFKRLKQSLMVLKDAMADSYERAKRDPRRWWRDVLASATAEFLIANLYALSSIIFGVLILGIQDGSSWKEAVRLNAVQGEVLIVSLAMIGPLAYSVVADPPIRWKKFFQIVIALYTLFAVCVYVTNKSLDNVNEEFMLYFSIVMLCLSLIINFYTTFNSHRSKEPADKMRDDTKEKISGYAEHVEGRV